MTFLKACCRWGHVFATGASPTAGPERKNWPCHPFPLFMAVGMIVAVGTIMVVGMILNVLILRSYCMRLSWAGSLNQLVPGVYIYIPVYQVYIIYVPMYEIYFFCTLARFSRLAAGLFSRSRLRGPQGARVYSRRKFKPRPCSVARALGVQSRSSWQVIMGFAFRRVTANQAYGKPH